MNVGDVSEVVGHVTMREGSVKRHRCPGAAASVQRCGLVLGLAHPGASDRVMFSARTEQL